MTLLQRRHHEAGHAQLHLAAGYPLAGMVESLAVLRTRFAGLQRDAILLTFRCKLILQALTQDCWQAHETACSACLTPATVPSPSGFNT